MAHSKFDFQKLGKMGEGKEKAPTNPIEIFEKLPSLPGSYNDLWRGQTDALKGWNQDRNGSDVLVALNTGAGKTVVGLLVAQSLVNEGLENVVYACATIDLVKQTCSAATQIGIAHTTRIEGEFNNDLFESGKAFCITTYHALFSGITTFRGGKAPSGLIFDDAHVAEGLIRDAFTLRVSVKDDPDVFGELVTIFEPHFRKLHRQAHFHDAVQVGQNSAIMAPPGAVRESSDRILALFANPKVAELLSFKFPLRHLQDHLDSCAVVFTNGACEIAPPFLPVQSLSFFQQGVRRVYLSATLQYKTDFARAFGREPSHVIEPKNDAGNGERLVLFANVFGNGGADLIARTFASDKKIIIAVPNYYAAERWKAVASPPRPENFTDELNDFRKVANGAFILVSRVDGIDLPHESCRLMLIDGLPTGASLLERYQWVHLDMKNLFAGRMANRLAQLFGRINRGRNDYGVFFIDGRDVTTWLNNDRNLALLPDLLRQQVLLGNFVQEQMNIRTIADVRSVVDLVLNRDQGWMSAYSDNVDKRQISAESAQKADEVETGLLAATKAEATYIQNIWHRDVVEARRALESTVEATSRADTKLGGWHYIWLGGCYEMEGDLDSAASAYRRARAQLNVNFIVPDLHSHVDGTPIQPLNSFASNVDAIAGLSSDDAFNRELGKLKTSLQALDGGTSNQMEEAVRSLGAFLGFRSTRPDNDEGTGPDVLWIDFGTKQSLPIELKTNKGNPAVYKKEDIGQAHNSVEWTEKTYSDVACLGLIIVGPDGKCTGEATPSKEMFLTSPTRLVELREKVLAILHTVRKSVPLNRRNKVVELCHQDAWNIRNLFEYLKQKALNSMQ